MSVPLASPMMSRGMAVGLGLGVAVLAVSMVLGFASPPKRTSAPIPVGTIVSLKLTGEPAMVTSGTCRKDQPCDYQVRVKGYGIIKVKDFEVRR